MYVLTSIAVSWFAGIGLALCFSYFGYEAIEPEKSQHWQQLRTYIRDGYRVLRNPAKLKAWMRIVDEHQDLFQSEAGLRLGQQIFEGTVTDLTTAYRLLLRSRQRVGCGIKLLQSCRRRIAELDETSRCWPGYRTLLALMGVSIIGAMPTRS